MTSEPRILLVSRDLRPIHPKQEEGTRKAMRTYTVTDLGTLGGYRTLAVALK
jgi:hypothetical protein